MEEVAVGKLTDIADGDYRIFALDNRGRHFPHRQQGARL